MNLKSALESLLFVQGEPLAVGRMVKITGAKKIEVVSALKELAHEYRERGIVLIANGDEWQFATHPASQPAVETLMASERSADLSRPGLEALGIIAYKGPVSRAQIEYIRGVDSSFTLRNLLIRGLISREENPSDRRSYLYRVSTDFLKHIGIAGIEDLPHYEAFRSKAIEAPGGDPQHAE